MLDTKLHFSYLDNLLSFFATSPLGSPSIASPEHSPTPLRHASHQWSSTTG